MKEMIKKVREDRKGFTLAELLIVVAIIAVLVAIAIPVFTSSLNRANAATDEANIRSGYASAQVYALTSASAAGSVTLLSDGTAAASGTAYTCKGNSSDLDSVNIGGLTTSWNKNQNITYTITADSSTYKVSAIVAAS